MDVFISWSGTRSREVAMALKNWLPKVTSAIKPFTSEDIDRRWPRELASRLENAHAGIICLTPANLHSGWILFECGALSNKICLTFLVGIEKCDLESPLNEFPCTHAAIEDEVWTLVKKLNNSLPEDGGFRKTETALRGAFAQCWRELEEQLLPLNQGLLPEEDFQVNAQVLDANGLFQRAEKEVLKAKESIFVVANYTLAQRPNPDAKDARKKYYLTLWDKVQSGIKYKRIVQLPHSNAAETMKYSHAFVDHLDECVEARKSKSKPQKNAMVYRCQKEQQLTSFLLIDRSIVFIEFYALTDHDGTKCCQLDSGIVIRGRRITRIFEEIFDTLRDESSEMTPEDIREFRSSLVPI